MGSKLQLKVFHTLWGKLNHPICGGKNSLQECYSLIKEQGFNGFEVPVSVLLDYDKKTFLSELKDNKFEWISQIFTDGPVTPGWSNKAGFTKCLPAYTPISDHIKIFQEQVEESLAWDAMKVNCQGNILW